MLLNFIRTAIRNLIREGHYTVIKIVGLSLGFGTSLALLLYITHELSYDTMHPDVGRTYRVTQTNIWQNSHDMFHSTGPAVASAIVDAIPEVESVMRINTPGSMVVKYQARNGNVVAMQEESVIAADSNFFSFFEVNLQQGDPATALQGVGKAVLSADAAHRLFGDEPAMGKIIQVGDSGMSVEVTGITGVQPSNMHFHFDYLLSMPTNPAVREFEWSWIWTQVVTYVRLRPGVDPTNVNARLRTLADRYAPQTFKRLGLDYQDFISEHGAWVLALQPVTAIHLYGAGIGNRLGSINDIENIYILGIIALFILLIAVVNFVNLSTARGAQRAKEVGVKKTLGVSRLRLVGQFQIEHIMLAAIAMLLGLGVMEVLRFIIQPTVGLEVPLEAWSPGGFAVAVLGITFLVGFAGGLYPAFYLTAFRPAQVLKGKLMTGFKSSRLRNILVVFQFTISIALMAATLIVIRQLRFFQAQDTGIDKEHLLIVNNAEKLGTHQVSFRNEVAGFGEVMHAGLSTVLQGGMEDIFNRQGDERQVSISTFKADEHFLEATGIQLAAGRGFDINRPSDKEAAIISETTARALGWSPEEAVGKFIVYVGDNTGPAEVIGVVKDFNIQSLRDNIMPVIFFQIDSKMWGPQRVLLVRYRSGDLQPLVAKLTSRWSQLSPLPFSYSLYDESLRAQYRQEERIVSMFAIFTVLSIAIAVIGLVGLVAYSVEQRKKEIGIRKVFGASRSGIYLLINRQYVILLAISFALATPVTWVLMQRWLDKFAYRVSMDPLLFVYAGVAELVLSLVCAGYLSLRASGMNPATVLKDE